MDIFRYAEQKRLQDAGLAPKEKTPPPAKAEGPAFGKAWTPEDRKKQAEGLARALRGR